MHCAEHLKFTCACPPQSMKYTLPDTSTATATGLTSADAVAALPSADVPDTHVPYAPTCPTNGEITCEPGPDTAAAALVLRDILRIRESSVSATYTLPLASPVTPSGV